MEQKNNGNYNADIKELAKIFGEMENAIIWCINQIQQLKKQQPCLTENQDAAKSEDSTRYPAEE